MNATTDISSLDERLRPYARELQAAGFRIYLYAGPRHGERTREWFYYSQVVDEVECLGYVQLDYFGALSHSMPIKPSREHGSAIVVTGTEGHATVEEARKVARPRNYGAYVDGVHPNHRERDFEDKYVELVA